MHMCQQGIWWGRVSQDYTIWVQLPDLPLTSCVALSWSASHAKLCPRQYNLWECYDAAVETSRLVQSKTIFAQSPLQVTESQIQKVKRK